MKILLFTTLMFVLPAVINAEPPKRSSEHPEIRSPLLEYNQSKSPEQKRQIREAYLKYYPAAKKGQERNVIRLPFKSRNEEYDLRVELKVGRNIVTDGVNGYGFAADEVDKVTLKNGITCYKVNSFGHTTQTLIGPGPNAKPITRFITGTTRIVPYRSREPLVIYVPEGGKVRYRIFKSSGKDEKAERK